jgi:hypothetical protein
MTAPAGRPFDLDWRAALVETKSGRNVLTLCGYDDDQFFYISESGAKRVYRAAHHTRRGILLLFDGDIEIVTELWPRSIRQRWSGGDIDETPEERVERWNADWERFRDAWDHDKAAGDLFARQSRIGLVSSHTMAQLGFPLPRSRRR